MRPELKGIVLILIIVCVVVTAFETIKSRDLYMERLPVYRQYRCAICHESSDPMSGSDLNPFGEDFRDNNLVWNRALAQKDSDNDDFSNGIELGDEDGDGTPEVSIERSNPGNPVDHPSSIDPKTWGIIKRLFAED